MVNTLSLTPRQQASYQQAIIQKAKATLARRNFLNFLTYTNPQYQVSWHHALLAERLDAFVRGECKRLMVFMPPRHGKSEQCSRNLPAYILGRNPNAQIIACSYGADLASTLNRDVQGIIDSSAYKELFPDTTLSGANVRTLAGGTYLRNSDVFEVVNHKGQYASAGVGGPITGKGFNYGIIDDPIKNQEEADSVTYREKLWRWYSSTFSTRQEKNACILIIVTRWHEDDLAGRLLALAASDPQADQWEVIRLPAIAENDTPSYPRHPADLREEGESLWPEKYDLDQLHKMRATMIARHWNALYQQRPTADSGGIFLKAWWRYYITPPLFNDLWQTWDMTFKASKSSDYVVGQVWGRAGANLYLLDQVRARMGLTETIEAFQNLCIKWPMATYKLVEYTANGPEVIATLHDQIPGIIPITPHGSKIARAQAVSWIIKGGNIYLPAIAMYADQPPQLASNIQDLVESFAVFPNGQFDDEIDACTQLLSALYIPALDQETETVETLDVQPVRIGEWD